MNNSFFESFKHIYIDNKASKNLFLLHGTGGSEKDLLPFVKELEGSYNFVGLKGNVSEHGMARFFERNQFGVFDQESIKVETEKLANFLKVWSREYQIRAEDTAFLGYSNGANMILAMLFYYPEMIHKAVILHGKLPFEPEKLDLKGKSFLLTYGEQDQMILASESVKAIHTLKELHAEVEVLKHEGGHEVKRVEVEKMQEFLLKTA